ncbi:MAG: hypothetical protein M5R41_10875 [Bacteroidia bacterium]|nr:hypothetical protein [Bacteroidia bacterium]
MFNTSETIKDLESIEGRRLLHEFFHDRRVKNFSEIRTLFECWKVCRSATNIQLGDGRRMRFESSLGMKLGTRVFFEEIVSTYYYNTIQGLVYFGAMLVLVGVGLYLSGYDLLFALGGLAIEALFLLLLATVTAFSRNDEPGTAVTPTGLSDTLISSINSSIREMTTAVSDLFRLISQTDIRQDVLLTKLTENYSRINSDNARKYLDRMDQTNALFREQAEATQALLHNLLQQQQQMAQQTRRLLNQADAQAGAEA